MDPVGLSPATLMEYVRRAMKLAEGAIQSGDKAQYAIEVLLRLIAESDMTAEEKALCRAIIDTGIMKGIFTLVVDGTKGKLNINKVKRSWKTCCPSLCGKPEQDEPALDPTPTPATTPAPAAAPTQGLTPAGSTEPEAGPATTPVAASTRV